jgi:hypothetical protein
MSTPTALVRTTCEDDDTDDDRARARDDDDMDDDGVRETDADRPRHGRAMRRQLESASSSL